MWYKVNKIRVGTQQVRPSGWIPNDNTLLYLPLQSDVVDKSWQSTTRVFSSSWISYTTVGWVPSIHIGTTWWLLLTTPNPLVTSNTANQTISVLVYVTSQSSSSSRKILEFAIKDKEHTMLHLSSNWYYWYYWESAWSVATPSWSIIANQRVHIVATTDSSSKKIYINWSLSASWAWSNTPRWIRPNSTEQSQTIFNVRWWLTGSQWLNWNARELIIEDKMWSAADVSKYYQRIKAKLWF